LALCGSGVDVYLSAGVFDVDEGLVGKPSGAEVHIFF
jgi:hypothetical protein